MKSTVLKYGIASILFLVLSAVAVVLISPVYNRVTEELRTVQKEVLDSLTENFGVSLKYDSMSPSILSALQIKNLYVYDAQTDTELLSVGRVRFKYNLFKILTGNFSEAFSELVLESGSVSYDAEKNALFREKITLFISSREKKDSTDAVSGPEDPNAALAGAVSQIFGFPFTVLLKNFSVSYTDDFVSAAVALKTVKLTVSPEDIQADINGSASANTSLAPALGDFAMSFGIEASVNNTFDRSSARIRLNSVSTADFSVSRLAFLLSASDSVITANMIQNLLPVQLSMIWDVPAGDMQVRLDAENFDPFAMVRVNRKHPVIDGLRGSTISGAYRLFFNTATSGLQYTANGSVSVTDKAVSGGASVSYDLSGTKKRIDIRHLSVDSPVIDASFEGSFAFDGLVPEGYAEINRLVMPNGGVLQTDIYIDPLDQGFTCFIPQLFLNEQAFTALELTVIPSDSSIDFRFEMSDFSHPEMNAPGVIRADGSFLTGDNPFLQAYVSFETFFLDSAAEAVRFFLDDGSASALESFVSALSPYAMSNELYFSSDLHSFSFNAPRIIAVNTTKEREFLVLSVTGNETAIDITELELLAAGQSLQADIHVDMAGTRDFLFNADFVFNSLPYTIAGAFVPGSYLNITGDYGLDVFINMGTAGIVNGTVALAGFPVPLNGYIPSLSLDSELYFDRESDWNISVKRFEVEDISGKIAFDPKLTLAGNIDIYCLFFYSIMYYDRISTVTGSGGVNWSYTDGVPDSLRGNLTMENPLTPERYSVAVQLSNPSHIPLFSRELIKNTYISVDASVQAFPFSRFMTGQNENSTANGTLVCLGTLDSLYVSFNVDRGTILIKALPMDFSGQLVLEDNEVTLNNTSIVYQKQHIDNFHGNLSLKTFSGSLSADYNGEFGAEQISAPVSVSVVSDVPAAPPSGVRTGFAGDFLPDSSCYLPDSFTVRIETGSIKTTQLESLPPFALELRRTPGRIDFTGGPENSVFGYYTDAGDILRRRREPRPARLTASGSGGGTAMDIDISGSYADLSKFEAILTYPYIAAHSAIITGYVTLSGLISDPEFSGQLTGTNVAISTPAYVTEQITAEYLPVYIVRDGLEIRSAVMNTKKGKVLFNLGLTFDRWLFDRLTMKIQTIGNTRVAAKTAFSVAEFQGDAGCDLDIDVTLDSISVTGSVSLQNASAVMGFEETDLYDSDSSRPMDTYIDLTVNIGQHVELFWPSREFPVIRGLVSSDAPLRVVYDSSTEEYSFRGNLALRGGEVFWIKRSFYLREGQINFNINQNTFDPIISLRGEVRERDQNGNSVRIILSAENQPLSQFTPRLSSDPPKSEQEILTLMGQIVTGDSINSDNNLSSVLVSASDIFTQMGVFRRFENTLRDFFRTDIFSVRTLFIQNAIIGAARGNSDGKPLTLGNFLDNSTVYIGKYFGPSMYADAMLHFSNDEEKRSNLFFGGVSIQPEIGFEMATPFFNVRWSIMPDNTDSLFVGDSSISLSWKFSL